jgi:hypothetical protein
MVKDGFGKRIERNMYRTFRNISLLSFLAGCEQGIVNPPIDNYPQIRTYEVSPPEGDYLVQMIEG